MSVSVSVIGLLVLDVCCVFFQSTNTTVTSTPNDPNTSDTSVTSGVAKASFLLLLFHCSTATSIGRRDLWPNHNLVVNHDENGVGNVEKVLADFSNSHFLHKVNNEYVI